MLLSLPHSELVSSQRQGNPRSSAHFKGQAVKNNLGAHAQGFTGCPPLFPPSGTVCGTVPDDKFGETAERLLKETVSPAVSEQYNSRGLQHYCDTLYNPALLHLK